MNRRSMFSKRTLQVERLHARQLMAVDLINEGAFCPPYESTALLASGESAPALTSTATTTASKSTTKPTYTYSVIGNPEDSKAKPTPGLALMGGGTDVDAAFAFMGTHAPGGDMVILSTTKHNYGNYINRLGSFDSVASLIVPDSSSIDTFVYNVLSNAEAIFIPGGDQSTYIAAWAGTAVEDAIYAMLGKGGVLGGTSAGLAVLGDVDYSAALDSTTSTQALIDPRATSITLDKSFLSADDAPTTILNYLQDTITDSHFMQRDRMGRTLAFMARADSDGLMNTTTIDRSRGIAINEQTALLIEANGAARVVGNPYAKKILPYDQQRSVYIMQGPTKYTLPPGTLTYKDVDVQRLTYDPNTGIGDTFSFGNWSSTNADHYTISAVDGILNASTGIYGPTIA